MATDYDAPRSDPEQDGSDDSPEEVKARRDLAAPKMQGVVQGK